MTYPGPESLRASCHRWIGVGLVVLLSACASVPDGARSPHDPLEPLNRAVYTFNEGVDDLVLRPAATVYRDAVPAPVRRGVTNVFHNLGDVWSSVNHLLQGKIESGLNQGMRVAINTTFGLLGLMDWATPLGLEREPEDFGQTLGAWGLPAGPYLVLPLLGPSSARDTVGVAADFTLDPVSGLGDAQARAAARTLNIVNTRARFLGGEQLLEAAALDRYTFVREGYFQRRRNLVYDGNPPALPDSDGDQPANGNR